MHNYIEKEKNCRLIDIFKSHQALFVLVKSYNLTTSLHFKYTC